MNYKLLFCLFVLLLSLHLSAQKLTVHLSQHPNSQAYIVVVHGVQKDTLGTIHLDKSGKGSLIYNNKHSFTGLANLTIKGKDYLSFDFVLSPNENPILICDGEYVYSQNTKILQSPENDCLNRWYDHVVNYKQIISINEELNKLYLPNSDFSRLLKTEKQTIVDRLQMLTDTINNTSLFAGKYMQFKIELEGKLTKVGESNTERKVAKNYFTNIDFEALYGSSLWFSVINTCIEAYVKEGDYYQTFGADVVSNLKRIKNQQVYDGLIDASISVTEKFSWNKDQDVIIDFIINDKRIKKPTIKLQKLIDSHYLTIGKKSPNLILINTALNSGNETILETSKLNSKYSLLLFYQSDCGHCTIVTEGLINHYQEIVKKGIKIISIAGDTSPEAFKTTASSFLWADFYCDFKGLNGVNFKNYGVLGTPTMYILNKSGNIIAKPATLEGVLDFVNKIEI